MSIIELRDCWRGYTDADVQSLQAKWRDAQAEPAGTLIQLSPGEHKALRAGADLWALTPRPSWTITLRTVAEVQPNPPPSQDTSK